MYMCRFVHSKLSLKSRKDEENNHRVLNTHTKALTKIHLDVTTMIRSSLSMMMTVSKEVQSNASTEEEQH